MNQDALQTTDNQTRSHITQIFRYIQAFNHLRNPVQQEIQDQPWVLWLHTLPDHPCIRPGSAMKMLVGAESRPSSDTQESFETEQNFVLKVSRPKLTEAPTPPKDIEACLQKGWQDIDGKAMIEPIYASDFDANSALQRSLAEWKLRRDRWAAMERPHRRAMQIFDQFYALHARLERESERLELMVGDGLLRWYPRNNAGIHHPVLLLRLQLQFNSQIPEFTLVETEQPPELYTPLFQALPEMSATDLGQSRRDFEQNRWHPLGGDDTSQFLKRLTNQLSERGAFATHAVSHLDKAVPLMTREPVLFLRNRTLGFTTALEAILEVLPHTDHLPHALTSLVGIDVPTRTRPGRLERASRLASPNGEDEQILLSKPANAEQLEVAHRLDQYGAVLVQGPPGTGKTHTIANLLGHLLAQGKSVLVTSHTPKALKVLREKVVPSLQPLCISILEDDNRKQMETAIDAITERLASSHVEALEQEAMRLTRHRLALLAQLSKTREELKEARSSEYQAILLAGQSYTPVDAARYITKHRACADWLPGPLLPNMPLPLSQEELVRLYQTNAIVTQENEQEISLGFPEVSALLPPSEFARLQGEQERLQKEDLHYRRDLWQQGSDVLSPATFEHLQYQLERALEPFPQSARWQLAAIVAGREGGLHRRAWDDLIAKIEQVHTLAMETQRLQLDYHPVVSERDLPQHTEKVLDEIIAYLEQHEKISGFAFLIHKDWKTFVQCTQVQGRSLERKEHFVVLRASLQLQSAREELHGRWQRQMTTLDAPAAEALGPAPEQICSRYLDQLRQCLQWQQEVWMPLENELRQHGLLWEKLLTEVPITLAAYGDLLRLYQAVQNYLPPVLVAENGRRLYASNETSLRALQQQLQHIKGIAAQSKVVQQLQEAVNGRSAQAYQTAYDRLVLLHERKQDMQDRHRLLITLEKSAPGWAAALRQRYDMHGQSTIPSNGEDAWLWRQLNDELERRSKVSLEDLQEKTARLSNDLQAVTAKLVEKKAWAAQVRRTTLEQRQALQGWKEIMRKIGKGTGKRVPRLRAEAHKLMPICQTAVPVWIMPLSQVVQNFDPRRNRFDVVIIDEASQADITALIAVYMGQQVVVVGDHEQVTPLAVGQDLDTIQRLIDEHLTGIRNAAIYDGRLSIYSLAQTTFEPVCLREHFRCVSPIIQFSNILSYDGKIKPLRDDSTVKRCPPTIAYRVKSSGTTGPVNEEEAQTIASFVVAATEQPEYQDATFGVISMVKEEQALRIDTLLRRYLSVTAYTHHQVLCGKPAQFQGDERDVIFLSMVDTPDNGPLRLRDGDANDGMYKKRFNVATSRARDQLWVVHSLDPDVDLKNGDIRKRLIQYTIDPQAFARQPDNQENKTESEFERLVMRRLTQAGYRVIPQLAVGSYRIDMVVEGHGRRLAVECDGDRWHTLENLEEDMARQAILERLGWRFVRIRGSQFFRNPDKAMESVFSRLHDLDIPAEGQPTLEHSSPPRQVLKETVIRRATALRQEWFESGTQSTSVLHHFPRKERSTPVQPAFILPV